MITVTSVESMASLPGDKWNQFAGPEAPFLQYEYLNALEESGSVSAATGWCPRHLKIACDGEIVALMPLYFKEHSQGEYVFDQGWAEAFHRNGFSYYPKWLTAIPFTPCQSKRVLIKEGFDQKVIYQTILQFLQQQSRDNDAATWHCLFSDTKEQQQLESLGMLIRKDVQFKWFNRGYRDFDDYLQQFSARKRKNIKRERRRIKEQGINLIRLRGTEVSEEQWQLFFEFYKMTYLKRRMSAYLNLTFFKLIAEQMAERLLLTFAIKEERYVGAALSLVGQSRLYGRYWGCYEEYNNLHFETCYYQGIEYCIENSLAQFDSGAQGEHKISRGFEPVITTSAHWIKEPRFAQAIKAFISAETEHISSYQDAATQRLPFKQNN